MRGSRRAWATEATKGAEAKTPGSPGTGLKCQVNPIREQGEQASSHTHKTRAVIVLRIEQVKIAGQEQSQVGIPKKNNMNHDILSARSNSQGSEKKQTGVDWGGGSRFNRKAHLGQLRRQQGRLTGPKRPNRNPVIPFTNLDPQTTH